MPSGNTTEREKAICMAKEEAPKLTSKSQTPRDVMNYGSTFFHPPSRAQPGSKNLFQLETEPAIAQYAAFMAVKQSMGGCLWDPPECVSNDVLCL